jgi:thiol-disulfide isomerase/thioredoxin
MKKIFLSIIVFALAFSFVSLNVNADTKKKTEDTKEEVKETKKKEKVTLYLFRRTGCPHCADEMTYLDTIAKKYKNKLNIVVYDTTQGDNAKLLEAVAKVLKVEVQGVPFNVIGSEHIEGYAETLNETFENLFDESYENQVKDIVKEVLAKGKYENLKETDLYEAMKEENLEITSEKSSKAKKDTIIIAVFFGVIIVAFGSLVYFSRKN